MHEYTAAVFKLCLWQMDNRSPSNCVQVWGEYARADILVIDFFFFFFFFFKGP